MKMKDTHSKGITQCNVRLEACKARSSSAESMHLEIYEIIHHQAETSIRAPQHKRRVIGQVHSCVVKALKPEVPFNKGHF